jgi:hypothetical protein
VDVVVALGPKLDKVTSPVVAGARAVGCLVVRLLAVTPVNAEESSVKEVMSGLGEAGGKRDEEVVSVLC